jgi:hypothetical protein
VSHLHITGSPIGITDGGVAAPGVVTISDVIISGGSALAQRGVEISSSTGTFNLERLQLSNLSNGGVVLAANGGTVAVTNSTFTNIDGQSFAVTGSNASGSVSNSTFTNAGGTAAEAAGAGSRVVLASSTFANARGVVVRASGSASNVQVSDTRIVSSGTVAPDSAVIASGVGASVKVDRSIITAAFSNSTNGDALVASGQGASIAFNASRIDRAGGNGAAVSGSGAQLYVTGTSTIANSLADGIRVTGTNAKLLLQDSAITSSGADGISISGTGSTALQATILRSSIQLSGNSGISATRVTGTGSVVQVYGTRINGGTLAGIDARSANVDVGRDPTVRNGAQTTIANTGQAGVEIEGDSRVRIVDTSISAVNVGISAGNGTGGTAINLTARNNTISLSGSGAGIDISGDAATNAQVIAQVSQTRISPNTGGISLTTVNPPPAPADIPKVIFINTASGTTDLSARNFGAAVFETPLPTAVTGTGGQPSLIFWNGPVPELPPTPQPLTSP